MSGLLCKVAWASCSSAALDVLLSAMKLQFPKLPPWFSRVRTVAAWMVIPAFLSMWIADRWLLTKFGAGPWPSWVARPKALELMLIWRNYSLRLVLVLSLIAIPRWQSIVGMIGVVLFLFYLGGQ